MDIKQYQVSENDYFKSSKPNLKQYPYMSPTDVIIYHMMCTVQLFQCPKTKVQLFLEKHVCQIKEQKQEKHRFFPSVVKSRPSLPLIG